MSDEDGLAMPESALLEPDSPVLEESESLELEVSGPPLLDPMSNGSDSPESDSEALESSDSVSDGSDSGSLGLAGPASDGAGSGWLRVLLRVRRVGITGLEAVRIALAVRGVRGRLRFVF